MRRLWIMLALVLVSCTTPTEPPPTPTLTPTATLIPTDTSTPEPTETPGRPVGLSDLLLTASQVERETVELSSATTDLRPEMIQAGVCVIDCAGMVFTTSAGALEITVYMIAFENEAGVNDMMDVMVEGAYDNGAMEVPQPEDTTGLESLPSNTVVLHRDRAWSLFSGYENIFFGVDIIVRVDTGQPTPPQDIILLGMVARNLAEQQVENLIEAGY